MNPTLDIERQDAEANLVVKHVTDEYVTARLWDAGFIQEGDIFYAQLTFNNYRNATRILGSHTKSHAIQSWLRDTKIPVQHRFGRKYLFMSEGGKR